MNPATIAADLLPQGVRFDQPARSTTSSEPAHVRLLDYEVEIGLVIGRELPVGTEVTEDNLADYVAGLVSPTTCPPATCSCPKAQFYEAKSYPTFTPVGPALVLLDRRRAQALR